MECQGKGGFNQYRLCQCSQYMATKSSLKYQVRKTTSTSQVDCWLQNFGRKIVINIYRNKSLLLAAMMGSFLSFPIHAETYINNYSTFITDSDAKVITTPKVVIRGVILPCASEPLTTCYYIHANEAYSLSAKIDGLPEWYHEYDFGVDGSLSHLLSSYSGKIVDVSGVITQTEAFTNLKFTDISEIKALSQNTSNKNEVASKNYVSRLVNEGDQFKLTGILRHGEAVIHIGKTITDHTPYYYLHLDQPIDYDSRTAEGKVFRQYDLAILTKPGNANVKWQQQLGSLQNKEVVIYGKVYFTPPEMPESICCVLDIYSRGIPRIQ